MINRPRSANSSNSFDHEPEQPDESPRSPIRPQRPSPQPIKDSLSKRMSAPTPADSMPPPAPTTDPEQALAELRRKMETVATEYATGKINRAQFNAVYGRYSEQRSIIERLVERNPDGNAWQQVVGSTGHTKFLRHHFEAQPLYFVVFRHGSFEPMINGGKTRPDMRQLEPLLKALWGMKNRPKTGLARKKLADQQWIVVALGEHTLTMVMFLLEPSVAQATLVRDLHADFERANAGAMARDIDRLDRMVFPQRALVETSF